MMSLKIFNSLVGAKEELKWISKVKENIFIDPSFWLDDSVAFIPLRLRKLLILLCNVIIAFSRSTRGFIL